MFLSLSRTDNIADIGTGVGYSLIPDRTMKLSVIMRNNIVDRYRLDSSMQTRTTHGAWKINNFRQQDKDRKFRYFIMGLKSTN